MEEWQTRGSQKALPLRACGFESRPGHLMTAGYDVEESATRLSSYLHVLRELAHLSCAHLPLEPRFEVKALLGDHLHDDALAAAELDARIAELGGAAGGPPEALAALLDRATAAGTPEYLEIAYGELKPSLIAAVRVHLERIDPVVDEPGLRILTGLLHRQERHVAELPAASERVVLDDLGALPPGEPRELRVRAPAPPRRDGFIAVAENGDRRPPRTVDLPAGAEERKAFVHALMNAALCDAERAARQAHERAGDQVELARRCWDAIRRAEMLDHLMATELGCHWGDHPVTFYEAAEPPPAWRDSDRRRAALGERGQEPVVRVFDYLPG